MRLEFTRYFAALVGLNFIKAKRSIQMKEQRYAGNYTSHMVEMA